jgi:hypothetical protein
VSFSSSKTAPNNVNLDSSQTLSNKTLDGTTVIQDGATITTPDIISPDRLDVKKDTYANLATYASTATNGQLCFATDSKVMYQVVDSALTEVGSGAGGINYISGDDSNFENSIGTWTEDAPGINIVLSHETTSPLRGSGSLKIQCEDVDLTSYTISGPKFTVDAADLAKKLTISFDYDCTHANCEDGDFQVAIIQDPDGTPSTIRVNGEDLLAGSGTHYAQFQTDSTVADYQLVLIGKRTTLTATTRYIDNVSVGPTNLAYGTIVTDWQPYTATLTNFTASSQTLEYRRIGDSIEIKGDITLNSAVTGDIQIGLPSGLVVGSSNRTNYLQGYQNGVTFHSGMVGIISGQSHFGIVDATAVSGWNATVPHTWASGDQILIPPVTIPIQGWSSNARMSEDLGGREVIAIAALGTTQAISGSGVSDVIEFDVASLETVGNMLQNPGTDTSRIVVPESGYYDLKVQVMYDNATFTVGNLQDIYLRANGVIVASDRIYNTATAVLNSVTYEANAIKYLNKGDYVDVVTRHFESTTRDLNVGGNTFLTVAKRSSPQTMLETETVAARYTSNSGQAILSTGSDLVYEDLGYDTHNAYNTSTGDYTVPVSGYYRISVSYGTASATWASGNGTNLQIRYDGTFVKQHVIGVTPQTRSEFIQTSTEIYCEKGKIIDIAGSNSQSANMGTTPEQNVLTISKIK